jgi:hypothetical protein
MAMVEMNWRPTDRQLRQFGTVAFIALPLVGWFWHLGTVTIAVLALVGAVMALAGWLYPQLLRFPFVGMCLLGLPIGIVVGELTLLIAFYCVFLPIGLLVRLSGRDDLQRSFDSQAVTYWTPKAQANGPGSYLRQF